MTQVFLRSKTIKPVERQDLEKALQELELAVSDMGDPNNVLCLGKILGAKFFQVLDCSGKIDLIGIVVKEQIKDFNIDKYPITNSWYREFMAVDGYRLPAKEE